MPRGFLVKRLQKHVAPISYRVRRYSDEDRSDSSSDHDVPDGVGAVPDVVQAGRGTHPALIHGHHHSTAPSLVLSYRGSPHVAYGDPDDPERRRGATGNHINNGSINGNNNHHHIVLSSNNNRPSHLSSNGSHHIHHTIPLAVHAHHHTHSSPASSPLSLTHGSPTLSDHGNGDDNMPLALTTTTRVGGQHHNHNPNSHHHLHHHHPPFYLTGFDRLAVTPTTPPSKVISSQSLVSAVAPPSPHKKRLLSSDGVSAASKPPRRSKAVRRLAFDEEKTSPVSGTIIREPLDEEEAEAESLVVRQGDIDPSFNVVEVTDEAKAEIAKIENRLGDYICQLCKRVYEDAFGLAQHRCSRIVHVEYRCPECDKVFNCPANLASHRRWHKPRPPPVPKSATTTNTTNTTTSPATGISISTGNPLPPPPRLLPVDPSTHDASSSPIASPVSSDTEPEGQFECETCGKKFRRQAYLRKHAATHRNQTVIKSELNHSQNHQHHHQSNHHVNQSHHHPSRPPSAGTAETSLHPSLTTTTTTSTTTIIPEPRSATMISENRSTPSPNATTTTTTTMDTKTTISAPPISMMDIESSMDLGCASIAASLTGTPIYTCKHCTCAFSSSPGLTRHINKFHPSETRQVILLQLPPTPQLRTNAQ